MADPIYGQPFDFDITLIDSTNRPYYRANPTLAVGDFRLSIDEAPLVNVADLPVVTPSGSVIVHVSLSAAEMRAENIALVAHDVAGAEWDDLLITIRPQLDASTAPLALIPGAGTVTAQELIRDALEKIGVLSSEQPLPPEYGAPALRDLNRLLTRYNIDHSMIYATTMVSTPLTGGVATYSIGRGADIDTARPTRLCSIYLRQGNIDYPMQEITEAEYSAISYKSGVVTSYPTYLYYEQGYPLGSVSLYPVPTGGTLFLNLETQFEGFSTTGESINLPPGYADCVIYDLGYRLAASYGRQLDATFLECRREALKYVRRNNRQPQIMGVDPYLLSQHGEDSTWIQHGGHR